MTTGPRRRGLNTLGALLPRRAEWSLARPARDLPAGVMVGLVALPLALGFGISSGLGAAAGLTTAIVAGALAAVFGGSRVQVSGPTGAMTVVLVPIAAAHGINGVLVVGMLAGLLLIAAGCSGAGRFIRYLPVPVIEGFTAGIAAVIALQQLPNALGVTARGQQVTAVAAHAVGDWLAAPAWLPPSLALAVAAALLAAARLAPRWPAALAAVALATVANAAFSLRAKTIGPLPAGLPAPHLPTTSWPQLQALLVPALAVAALAALESLLSATVSDAMSVGTTHDPDRELMGQGLANLGAALFGGIPATAAIARTAVNVRAGAASRLAALTHALFLLAVVALASRWVAQIPLAALAGVLIATAVQMVRLSSLAVLARAHHSEALILAVTAGATIVFDLVTAVITGLVLAGFFALRQTALSARLDQVPLQEGDHRDEEHALLDEQIVAYRIDGPLFFAAAHDFLLELTSVSNVRVIILRMSRVTTMDATGAHVLADTVTRLDRRGITVLLSGVRPQHQDLLRRLGIHDRLDDGRHLFETTPQAIDHARTHAGRRRDGVPDPSRATSP